MAGWLFATHGGYAIFFCPIRGLKRLCRNQCRRSAARLFSHLPRAYAPG